MTGWTRIAGLLQYSCCCDWGWSGKILLQLTEIKVKPENFRWFLYLMNTNKPWRPYDLQTLSLILTERLSCRFHVDTLKVKDRSFLYGVSWLWHRSAASQCVYRKCWVWCRLSAVQLTSRQHEDSGCVSAARWVQHWFYICSFIHSLQRKLTFTLETIWKLKVDQKH